MRIETVELKPAKELHQELRENLDLLDVTEKQNAGIHDDAFYVGRTMFMAYPWSRPLRHSLVENGPETGSRGRQSAPASLGAASRIRYVDREEQRGLGTDMELIRMSHQHFAGTRRNSANGKSVIEIYTADFVSPKFICVLIREQCVVRQCAETTRSRRC